MSPHMLLVFGRRGHQHRVLPLRTRAPRVGQLYAPDKRYWEPNRGEYTWRYGAHELRLFLADLTDDDIRAVNEGPCEFAFLEHGAIAPAILFCYHFGDALPWSDNPYTWHALSWREQQPGLPMWQLESLPTACALLHIVLVRAETGIVEGLRVVTFSPAFTAALHQAIHRQAETPYDDAAFEEAVIEVHRRYSTPPELAHAPGAVRCIGSDLP